MADAPPPADTPPANGDAAPVEGSPPATGGRPAAPRKAGARPWQGGRFHATGKRGGPSARRRTIFVLLAIMLALGGAIAAWVLYPGSLPRPYFTAIAIDQYRDPRIPVNQWTTLDREALRARGWPESNAFDSQQRDRLLEELHSLGRNLPADQPLVVYLCAYALPLSDGGLALLPGDADLDNEKTWLPLRDVLGPIQECAAKRKVLVLLDLAQPFADARAGALTNDAAARADPVVRKAVEATPNLLALCSCSPGQNSLASEEMGHTVFVRYLLDGLAGKADGWGGGARDNRVSTRELAAFVTANVDRWAVYNRAVRQTPVLLGAEGLDVGLTVDDPSAPAADAPLDKTYPSGIKDAWDLRDRWKADLRVSTPPTLTRELEEDALRAEARWRGGARPEEVQPALKEQTGKLESRRGALPGASARGEPRSLALAVAAGRTPPEDKDGTAVFQLNQMAKLQPDKQAEKQLEAQKTTFLKDYENKPFDLAWMVFRAAKVHPEAGPAALAFWLGLHPDGKPPIDYAELHILESLSGLEVKDPAKEWPTPPVLAALRLSEAAEQAHAALDLCPPTAAPVTDWLRAWADEADGRRQAAEDALLNAKPAERAGTARALDAVLADARGYDALTATVRGLTAALRCRDDALTLLPGYAATVERDSGRESDWKNAVEQARTLQNSLANPPAQGPSAQWLGDVGRQRQSLQVSLNNLLEPVNSRLGSVNPPNPKAGAADAEDMRALLRLPALSASQRLALWTAWSGLADRLNGETLSQTDGPALEPPSPSDADRARAEGRDRARRSLALLRLLGVSDVAKVEAALEKADGHPSDDAALATLGQELRAGWKRTQDIHGH